MRNAPVPFKAYSFGAAEINSYSMSQLKFVFFLFHGKRHQISIAYVVCGLECLTVVSMTHEHRKTTNSLFVSNTASRRNTLNFTFPCLLTPQFTFTACKYGIYIRLVLPALLSLSARSLKFVVGVSNFSFLFFFCSFFLPLDISFSNFTIFMGSSKILNYLSRVRNMCRTCCSLRAR